MEANKRKERLFGRSEYCLRSGGPSFQTRQGVADLAASPSGVRLAKCPPDLSSGKGKNGSGYINVRFTSANSGHF
jgi:hypothetical protein